MYFDGCFDGHGDAPVQCSAHFLMKEVYGHTGSHWMPRLGKNLHCIAPVAAMIIDSRKKVLWCCGNNFQS
jgi:hypothetical protein